MRKIGYLILSLILVFTFAACSTDGAISDSSEKYSLNISYGFGGDDTKTEISFDANIGGSKDVISNIDAYEILINEERLDLLLANGPHTSKDMGDYLQITGIIVFDNIGMTKEEINAITLFEGIKLIDKDGAEYVLFIPQDEKPS